MFCQFDFPERSLSKSLYDLVPTNTVGGVQVGVNLLAMLLVVVVAVVVVVMVMMVVVTMFFFL